MIILSMLITVGLYCFAPIIAAILVLAAMVSLFDLIIWALRNEK